MVSLRPFRAARGSGGWPGAALPWSRRSDALMPARHVPVPAWNRLFPDRGCDQPVSMSIAGGAVGVQHVLTDGGWEWLQREGNH